MLCSVGMDENAQNRMSLYHNQSDDGTQTIPNSGLAILRAVK